MNIPATIQTFRFANTTVEAYVPSQDFIKSQFENNDNNNTAPYWAQVWPAAKALCEVLAANTHFVKNKNVLEIAAGLGLPSLLAAPFAKQVTATDYISDAVEIMEQSAMHNHFTNMQCKLLDWNAPGEIIKTDVLLLSDINYDPVSFDVLYKLLVSFIENNTMILLSTPQRLTAKTFMERLQPWCKQTFEPDIIHNSHTVYTSVWLLQQ